MAEIPALHVADDGTDVPEALDRLKTMLTFHLESLTEAGGVDGFRMGRREGGGQPSEHGVSFDEAATVFDDPLVIIFHDEAHSVSEDHWLAIGISDRGRLIVVSHGYRGGRTRIISARKATANEVREYAER